ncbi:hypothetical protein Tco_0627558 [Tanacetum coccineum]|uniref:Uncharacterized protein n=1 Tax=Tanacetum coccineum TaxID=301880 RepID=A0ABQ4WNL1_9ASTR
MRLSVEEKPLHYGLLHHPLPVSTGYVPVSDTEEVPEEDDVDPEVDPDDYPMIGMMMTRRRRKKKASNAASYVHYQLRYSSPLQSIPLESQDSQLLGGHSPGLVEHKVLGGAGNDSGVECGTEAGCGVALEGEGWVGGGSEAGVGGSVSGGEGVEDGIGVGLGWEERGVGGAEEGGRGEKCRRRRECRVGGGEVVMEIRLCQIRKIPRSPTQQCPVHLRMGQTLEDEILLAEEQPLHAVASPTTDSPGYVPESDPEEEPEEDDEDPEEDPTDYPADRDDDDDEEEEEPSEDDADDEDEDEDEDEEEEEEHPASADSVHRMTARISIRDEPSISLPPKEEGERLLALTTTPPSPLTPLSSPLPQISSPPLPASPPASVLPASPPASLIRPLGYRAAMIQLRAETPSTSHPSPLTTSSPPLYEIREGSSAAAARPTGGRRADYGFVGTMDTEIRRQRAEEVGYGIRDVWVDPKENVEEVAPITLEGVNTRVTELTAVQEQDTQDIYAVIGDTQDRQTQIYQSVETLVDDSQYHYETARLLDQEALVSREAWGRSIEVSYMTRSEIMALRSVVMGQQAVISQLQAADRRSQAVTSEMLQADHRRQAEIAALQTFDRTRQEQLVQTLTLMQSLQGQVTTLQGQVTALQGQQGPSGGPAQPVAPEEAGSSS